MRITLFASITLALLASVGAAAAEPASQDGKALFHEKCSMCHRVMGMGTNLLSRRYAPAEAMLEDRTNLSALLVQTAARVGLGNMPRITRGEVSDPQLQAIAAYLSKGNP